MPGTPTLGVSIDFANGPAFGNPLILDDPTSFLDSAILADAPADVVDVSNIAIRVNIRRGRNRILNNFEELKPLQKILQLNQLLAMKNSPFLLFVEKLNEDKMAE